VPVLERFGVEVDSDRCREARGDDEAHDQYTIPEGRNMCYAVLFHHDTGRKHPKSLLGNFGHLERSAAWVHLIGGVAFGVYAALRPSVITQEHTLPETMTTVAAWAVSFCFLSSTVYHITAPSQRIAYWTRMLDFFGSARLARRSSRVACSVTLAVARARSLLRHRNCGRRRLRDRNQATCTQDSNYPSKRRARTEN
jgi:hypothetical protein